MTFGYILILKNYYYLLLIASTGSILAALNAGIIPAKIPDIKANPIPKLKFLADKNILNSNIADAASDAR